MSRKKPLSHVEGQVIQLRRELKGAADEASRLARLSQLIKRPELTPSNPQASPQERCIFQKAGEGWRVEFEGETVVLQDLKCVRLLGALLHNPYVDYGPQELEVVGDPPPPTLEAKVAKEDDLNTSGLSDLGATYDSRAIREIQESINYVMGELEHARKNCDQAQLNTLSDEKEKLLEALSSQAGKGGRPRKMKDPDKHAYDRVNNAIRRATLRIRQRCPKLGEHLKKSLKTGRSLCYRPDEGISWSA